MYLQPRYGIDLGLGSNTPGYSVESYIHGQQYVFGFQFGSTYKVNENLAVYGGFRFNYIYNKYEGSISNITVNINGQYRQTVYIERGYIAKRCGSKQHCKIKRRR